MRRRDPASSTRSDPAWPWQRREHLLADPERAGQQDRGAGVPSAPAARTCRRLSSTFLPKPRSPRIRPASAGGAQRFERVDAQLVVQAPRSLRAEVRQVHDRDQAGRVLGAKLLRRGNHAALVEGAELLLERLAMPGSSVTRFSRVSAITPTEDSRTVLAAVR
jgi:hypothetical protein